MRSKNLLPRSRRRTGRHRLLQLLEDRLLLSTVQGFDGGGSAFVADQHPGGVGPDPVVIAGGPTGNFIRLATTGTLPDHNGVSFARTDTGSPGLVVADFDFRITPFMADENRADGLGFVYLNTAFHGVAGLANPLNVAEEPEFAGSLGVGFDIHAGPDDESDNHVSIHFNDVKVREQDVSDVVDLASGRLATSGFIHARVILRPASSDVTVILTPAGGTSYTVIDRQPVDGFIPYEGRVQFSARSGGEAADFDLDNVSVQYLNPTQSVFSFSSRFVAVSEQDGLALVTIERAGNTESAASVDFATASGSALAGADFATTTGTLMFPGGVTRQTIQVPVVNDPQHEGLTGTESFRVSLSNPTGGAVIAQPDSVNVTIVDDERGREVGHWSSILDGPDIVGVHLHLLPTGQVMFWDSMGEASLWSPTTNRFTRPAMLDPHYDIFCSGHNFLADGTLLVTGGHEHEAGDGLDFASLYNPFTDSWTRLPDMLSGGRWYPTNTILADGSVAVVSGSIDVDFTENTLPQVWQPRTGDWRDLTDADGTDYPESVDLYPRNFLDPTDTTGRRIFRAGPDQDGRFLETAELGGWTDGPDSQYGNRTYGAAAMYEPGKILIAGGDEQPTATAEVIDLNSLPLEWRTVATAFPSATTPDMAFSRRHHNATMLPDGTVLITGGSSTDGFDDNNPVFAAEMWDPGTGNWTTWADMQIRRHYHGTALLLPDGRVLSMGGGEGGLVQAQTSYEIFSPPYLFQGPRPRITGAPAVTSYGRTFLVQTPDAASISGASLVRLGSVTHGFDQNQQFLKLPAPTQAPEGVNVTIPTGSHIIPPGHYMMFLLNDNGVPSIASIIQVLHDRLVTGSGAGGAPQVKTFDPALVAEQRSFLAYAGNFTGGVTVASGDITGDGVPDVITGAGRGGGPQVRVFDGATGQRLPGARGSFFAFANTFTGGVFVASGDVNHDGRDDIIVGAGAGGGPQVRVFSGIDGARLMSFFVYSNTFTGGVSVASGDVNIDGHSDIITGPSTGAEQVKVFSGVDRSLLRSLFPYGGAFGGGVHVASGDINGDGKDDVITGAGRGGGPQVRVFSGDNGARLASFFAYPNTFTGGVRVASTDTNDDGHDEIITGAGPGNIGPQVKTFHGVGFAMLDSFFPYATSFTGGVFVAAPHGVRDAPLRLHGDLPSSSVLAEPITFEQLDRIRLAALQIWQDERFHDVRFEVTDLPGSLLGRARPNIIQIDSSAAGRGWFVDQTPETSDDLDPDRVDLLTVVLHELGHVLGLNHNDSPLMQEQLSVGIRHLPDDL